MSPTSRGATACRRACTAAYSRSPNSCFFVHNGVASEASVLEQDWTVTELRGESSAVVDGASDKHPTSVNGSFNDGVGTADAAGSSDSNRAEIVARPPVSVDTVI
mmetsp:Transcript_44022/g.99098  ORF Transcript_44022/g.99098 Transcript_44022/m.99098 type:complete len:105 (+) Transcript_44022:307-621(+)